MGDPKLAFEVTALGVCKALIEHCQRGDFDDIDFGIGLRDSGIVDRARSVILAERLRNAECECDRLKAQLATADGNAKTTEELADRAHVLHAEIARLTNEIKRIKSKQGIADAAKEILAAATPDERTEFLDLIFADYCRHCGAPGPCYCWNDE